jgi:hypothetical protein
MSPKRMSYPLQLSTSQLFRLLQNSTLIMETECSTEMMISTYTAPRCHKPEERYVMSYNISAVKLFKFHSPLMWPYTSSQITELGCLLRNCDIHLIYIKLVREFPQCPQHNSGTGPSNGLGDLPCVYSGSCHVTSHCMVNRVQSVKFFLIIFHLRHDLKLFSCETKIRVYCV